MQPTQYPDVNELLDVLLSKIRAILDDRLAGLYLYGSLVWGDFDHDISDIDLLAATTKDISDSEFAELKDMHADIARANENWDNRIEVQYLSLSGLKTFRSEATKMALISPGEPFHLVEAGREWLMNWYLVQEKGVTLFGLPPRTIIEPPISKEEFMRASVQHARTWREWITHTADSRPYQGYAILTLCRALYAYRNGEQVSKKQAALWVGKELPAWALLIERALEWRREARRQAKDVDPSVTYPETRRFVLSISDLMGVE